MKTLTKLSHRNTKSYVMTVVEVCLTLISGCCVRVVCYIVLAYNIVSELSARWYHF